jgi:hypothetical protein
MLGADDNWEAVADRDFNDVVLRCQNIDPDINPWYPFTASVWFLLPEKIWHRGQAGDQRDKIRRQLPNEFPVAPPDDRR